MQTTITRLIVTTLLLLSSFLFSTASQASMHPTDATLSDLMLSDGTLEQTFASDTFTYTASVDNTVDMLTLTPTTSQTGASATVNGNPASTPITLVEGSNAIDILVTATDTTTTQTYTLLVTRTPDDDKFVTKWSMPAGNNEARTLTFPSSGDEYDINWG